MSCVCSVRSQRRACAGKNRCPGAGVGSAGGQQLGIRSVQQSCLNALVGVNLAILVLSAQSLY